MLEEVQKRLSLSMDGGQITLWNIQDDIIEFDGNYGYPMGLEQRKFTKDDFRTYIHPDDIPLLSSFYETLHQSPNMQIQRIRFCFDKEKEDYQWFELRCSSLKDAQGKIMMAGIMQNIQKQTEHEEQLILAKQIAEKAELKQSFLNNMSHEIRTPLNAITGFSELMAFADTDEERMSYYDVIKMNNQLLMQLINDILDISKIEADAIKITYEQLDVSELMDTIYASAKLRVPGGVKLVLEKEADHHMFGTDSMRLLQLINNLVNNAIKNTKEGSITMGYTIQPDDQLRFYVRDTGIGIDKEKLKDVFDRFVKINDYMEGIGLGLAICKGLVVKMGGSIHVTSELGVGSEFSFILPSHE